jgi:hypothetical protein
MGAEEALVIEEGGQQQGETVFQSRGVVFITVN